MDQTIKDMLAKGEDPKDMLIELCKPECVHWKGRLDRCEKVLSEMVEADPEKSCMYTARDYYECIETCVQPKIHRNLKGNESGWFN